MALGRNDVPVDEGFLALGGDSLAAVSLLSVVEGNFPLSFCRWTFSATKTQLDLWLPP